MAFAILGNPKPQFFDSSGAPLVSGTLAVLDPADDTNKASYPDYDNAEAATNANDNPITLDARGECDLWGLDGEDYKLVLKNSNGDTIWTTDDVFVPGNTYTVKTGATEAQIQAIIDAAELTNGHIYFEPGTYSGNWTITAALTIHASLGVILQGSDAAAVVNCTGDFVTVIGGLKVDGNSTSIYAWHHEGANNCKLDSLWLTGATSHGLYIQGVELVVDVTEGGSYYNQWNNLVSKSNGGDGVKIYGTDTPAHRANVNNFYGGQIASNTGDGFDIDTCAGTGIFGTSIETNTGYALKFTDCVIAAVNMHGGWIESNTAGGVNIDATTKMVQIYGTRFNQSTEFSGAGAGNSGNVFMVDTAAGVLTRWMQTIGQNLQSPYIITPLQQTERVATYTGTTNAITALMSGQTFTNNGEGAAATQIQLPAAVAGLKYTIIRNSASYAFQVDPDGTEIIRNAGTAGGAGKYLSLDTNAGSVTLQCSVAGAWEITAINGGSISFEA
jgi:hypothetical protein